MNVLKKVTFKKVLHVCPAETFQDRNNILFLRRLYRLYRQFINTTLLKVLQVSLERQEKQVDVHIEQC